MQDVAPGLGLEGEAGATRVHGDPARELLDSAPFGAFLVEPSQILRWSNRTFADQLGYSAAEMTGRNISQIVSDAKVSEYLARGETISELSTLFVAKDGSIHPSSLSMQPHFEDGALRHTRCFTRPQKSEAIVEDRFRTIADMMPTLLAYVDRSQRYLALNRSYERWFGVPTEQMIGRELKDVLGPRAFELLRGHVETVLAGTAVSFASAVAYDLGGERYIEATYTPHFGADGQVDGFVSLVSDATEKKRFEDARAQAVKRSEQLARITALLARAISRDEVYCAIVDGSCAIVEARACGLWMIDETEDVLRLVRSAGFSESSKGAMERLPLDLSPSVPVVDAFRKKEPLWFDSREEILAGYPHLGSLMIDGQKYRSVCLPVLAADRAFGAFSFSFEDECELDQEQRAFLLMVARSAGQALERMRLFEAEHASRAQAEASAARMELLSRASKTFAAAGPDTAGLLQTVAREATGANADSCAILLIAEDREHLVPVASHFRSEAAGRAARAMVASSPLKLANGLNGSVAKSGRTLRIADISEFSQNLPEEHRDYLAEHRIGSTMIVPLRARAEVIGTLTLTRERGRAPFGEDDQHLFEELAERAAMAILTAQLYRDNQQARTRAELLYHLARSLIEANSAEDVYQAALEAIARALGTDRSAILLFDEKGVMRFHSWRGLSEEYRLAVEGHSPWQREASDPQPIFIADIFEDPSLANLLPVIGREGVRSLGFIPLIAGGRLLGKFMVYYGAVHQLSPQELELARAIANHVAAAVSRFKAVDQLQQTVHFNEMFTAVLGHDLRNPLAAIMTAAQVAMKRGDDEKILKPLSRIMNSGERMSRMIDQLLDFTRVRVGEGIPLSPRPIDVVVVLRQVIDELEGAHPTWKFLVESTGDTTGTWDPDRLLQVFSNLTGNAVQHGFVDEGVRLRVDGSASDRVFVEIWNRGRIPEEITAKLFEPMTGGKRRRDKSQGLGLGLFISQRIAEAHGGEISVRSTAEGTLFTVSLPRARSEAMLDL
jgi:PAS domain S-box-containing protein